MTDPRARVRSMGARDGRATTLSRFHPSRPRRPAAGHRRADQAADQRVRRRRRQAHPPRDAGSRRSRRAAPRATRASLTARVQKSAADGLGDGCRTRRRPGSSSPRRWQRRCAAPARASRREVATALAVSWNPLVKSNAERDRDHHRPAAGRSPVLEVHALEHVRSVLAGVDRLLETARGCPSSGSRPADRCPSREQPGGRLAQRCGRPRPRACGSRPAASLMSRRPSSPATASASLSTARRDHDRPARSPRAAPRRRRTG